MQLSSDTFKQFHSRLNSALNTGFPLPKAIVNDAARLMQLNAEYAAALSGIEAQANEVKVETLSIFMSSLAQEVEVFSKIIIDFEAFVLNHKPS